MDLRLLIILGFAGIVLTLIYKFESPSKNTKKMTGRGGDFAE